jgi:TnpA family transposase
MPRIKIFNALEIEAFESPPVFNSAERRKFFSLPAHLQKLRHSFYTPLNQVCFTLLAGYFRARHKFFGQQFRRADVKYVAAQLGVNEADIRTDIYQKPTLSRHQQMLLDFFGYRRFDQAARQLLSQQIAGLVNAQARPKMMLLAALEFLIQHRIALPGYTTLADLIGDEINHRQRDLTKIVSTHLTDAQRQRLEALLEKDAVTTADGTTAPAQRYRLTLLKQFHQSTKPGRIKANLADWQLLSGLYEEVAPVITALGLSQEGLSYYAHAVIKAEIFQVTRRAAADRHLHLLAFIAYQTFRLQDILIDTLLQCVQATLNTTQREHKEQYYQSRGQRHQVINELLAGLDQHLLTTFTEIQRIIADQELAAHEQVTRIAQLIEQQEPERNQVTAQLRELQHAVQTAEHQHDYYAMLGKQSLKLQNRVADLVRCVHFEQGSAAPSLLKAIAYYQEKDGELDKHAPTAFLSAQEQKTIFDDHGKLQVSLYKALLFVGIADAIKAGALNLRRSHKYRSLEDYLIAQDDWQAARSDYLQRAELTKFADCHLTLRELRRTLEEQYRATNECYLKGHNPLLKFRPDQTFYVTTPKAEEAESEASLPAFFPERKYISLLEVLATVNQATHFLDEFEHWQQKRQRRRPSEKTLLAGIVGLGCDIGEKKIAQISQQINEHELENTLNWYFSVANLHAANDRILSVLAQLELPNLYRRDPNQLHTSSDGQKFEVAVESLNARHSFKYFGQNKGATVYSFIDERHLLWHSTVISAAEREAAYVIDGLLHNEVVKSDIHSTDTHGYGEIIFGATFLLGFAFAPRIAHLDRQRLYAFEKRKVYQEKGYVILPDAYIDTALIAAQWDEVLRFIATIKLKHTTASQLFKRLNSYSRQHPLYGALKEFGKNPKTIFILKYVDDAAFRQAIEKQLNKVESSHKFSRAISFGHGQEIIQADKAEQDLAEGCRRLIKNAIICWNYLYLTQQLQEAKTEERRAELLTTIKNGSVVSWQHINLHGEYDFSDEKLSDSVGLNLREILGFGKGKNREGENTEKANDNQKL